MRDGLVVIEDTLRTPPHVEVIGDMLNSRESYDNRYARDRTIHSTPLTYAAYRINRYYCCSIIYKIPPATFDKRVGAGGRRRSTTLFLLEFGWPRELVGRADRE